MTDVPPALALRNVSIAYGSTATVNDVSLTIQPGETFGLIGLNGVGKTTLIKAILGLRNHRSGTIEINGLPHDLANSRRRLAYLPERFDPPAFLNGLEFLRFTVRLYGGVFDRAQAETQAEALALPPAVLDKRVHTYSKGMRQKLGLVATLLTDCNVLILDEPMSGLDPRARALVKDALRTARRQGRTVFLSSHILSDMSEICDRVAVLDRGALLYTGTTEGLLAQGRDDNLERAFLNVLDAA